MPWTHWTLTAEKAGRFQRCPACPGCPTLFQKNFLNFCAPRIRAQHSQHRPRSELLILPWTPWKVWTVLERLRFLPSRVAPSCTGRPWTGSMRWLDWPAAEDAQNAVLTKPRALKSDTSRCPPTDRRTLRAGYHAGARSPAGDVPAAQGSRAGKKRQVSSRVPRCCCRPPGSSASQRPQTDRLGSDQQAVASACERRLERGRSRRPSDCPEQAYLRPTTTLIGHTMS